MIEAVSHILIRPGDQPAAPIGGKARNLLTIHQLGLDTPSFVIIPDTWFESFCGAALLDEKGVPDFDKIQLPASLLDAVLDSLPASSSFFAVRSSFRDEDAGQHSFAGQFKSRLFVPAEGLEEAILDVWSSCVQSNVATYQQELQLERHYFLSIIIQEMLEPEVSGVAFSMNPVSGHRYQQVINAVYGVGEGLVSGELDADQFLVEGEQVESRLVKKTHQVVFHSATGAGVCKEEVPAKQQDQPSLNSGQIGEVVAALRLLRNHFQLHQDVEFAFQNGQLFILQARPVTNAGKIPDISGKYIVWDNSNIIESYPGITSPLTFSYIIKLYERAYRQFVALMGVAPKEIDRNGDYFANMLGLLNGRIYYNLRSWYKMISMLPGYSFNARFMEQMMGVKDRFDLDPEDEHSKFGDVFRMIRMTGNILWNLFTLESQKRKFVRVFESMETEYQDLDPDALQPHQIMELYKRQESLMLSIWKAPLVNDFFAMIYFGLLKKSMTNLFGEDTNMHNDLLMGGQAIITTKPAELIARMVNRIYETPALLERFQQQDCAHILQGLQTTPEFRSLREEMDQYIHQFGDRMVGELKLETITYRQQPELFIEVLQTYIHQNLKPLRGASGSGNSELRIAAQKALRHQLRRRPLRYWLVRHVLKRARQLVAGRENLRLYRTRAFGWARTTFLQLGKIFFAEGLLQRPEDIFMLTKEEIFDYIKGTSANYDLSALVELRRRQFEAFQEEPMQSERIKTHGIVYLGNSFYQEETEKVGDGDLNGIGCCKGIVRGRVKVVRRPEEVYESEGEILVTTSTDPGWVTIFPSISGILVERGSLLSHAAIVSREMGIPCIVGIKGLTTRLKTGDIVEMDGEKGMINILKRHDEQS
jgi:phosphohistidine swiveling domain-containing protein